MAHYAFLDEDNIVTEVIVGIDEAELIEGLTPEEWYGKFRNQKCVRTSYMAKFAFVMLVLVIVMMKSGMRLSHLNHIFLGYLTMKRLAGNRHLHILKMIKIIIGMNRQQNGKQ